MYINSRGGIRLVMPNGGIDVDEVKRVLVGPVQSGKDDFPKYFFRTIKIETDLGLIELMIRADDAKSLDMQADGETLIARLTKQIVG